MQKNFKLVLKIKSTGKQPLPDWGLGEGVLATQEGSFNDEDIQKYGEFSLGAKLNELKENLIEKTVQVDIVELP